MPSRDTMGMQDRGAKPPRTSPVPLVDELTALLRERIYSQRYVTGEWLKQEHLSKELGVSRTPLREAFKRLEQEGLVRNEPGRGTRVITGDVETLLSAYELRAVIDGLAAKLAARSVSTARIRELRRIIELQKRTVEPWTPRSYSKLNVDFHESVAQMADNEFVSTQTTIIRITAQVFAPVSVLQPISVVRAIDDHAAIVDAIESRDEALAEALARGHITRTISLIRDKGTPPDDRHG